MYQLIWSKAEVIQELYRNWARVYMYCLEGNCLAVLKMLVGFECCFLDEYLSYTKLRLFGLNKTSKRIIEWA